jgi:hypothetical protein
MTKRKAEMTKRTRHATREALGMVTRQSPQPEEIDALLASIPTRERRERKAARQQQRKER